MKNVSKRNLIKFLKAMNALEKDLMSSLERDDRVEDPVALLALSELTADMATTYAWLIALRDYCNAFIQVSLTFRTYFSTHIPHEPTLVRMGTAGEGAGGGGGGAECVWECGITALIQKLIQRQRRNAKPEL